MGVQPFLADLDGLTWGQSKVSLRAGLVHFIEIAALKRPPKVLTHPIAHSDRAMLHLADGPVAIICGEAGGVLHRMGFVKSCPGRMANATSSPHTAQRQMGFSRCAPY